jgi:type IV pilus assembly protein PilC
MAKFKYSAIGHDGATITGVEEGVTRGQVAIALANRDLDVIDLTEARSKFNIEITKGRVPRKELMHFSRQLAVFIRAGIPIIEGLETISEDTGNKRFKTALVEMAEGLRAGMTFSGAAEAQAGVFPPFYLGILRSAELTGNLDEVMDQLAGYLERDMEARQKIIGALIYPIIVMIMAMVSVGVLLTYVMPKFVTFFEGFDAKLPLQTRILINGGNFFGDWWWLMFLVAAAIVIGFALYFRTEGGKVWRDKRLLGFPVIGDLVQHAILERFCRILSSMVGSGVPLPDALVVVSEATNNRVYRAGLDQAREEMIRGEGLAAPLVATGLFPPAARQMFRVGEDTGTLDQQMKTAATYFERELEYKLKRFTSMFEPAVILVAGSAVGFIAIALVSAMYGIFHQVNI